MFHVIPAMVGVAVAIAIHEFNRRKMDEYYKEQEQKNRKEIEALYKRYVR